MQELFKPWGRQDLVTKWMWGLEEREELGVENLFYSLAEKIEAVWF